MNRVPFYLAYPIVLLTVTVTWAIMNIFVERVTWMEGYKLMKEMSGVS